MQKLAEASDRKKGRRMHKEKGTSWQKEEAHSLFSSDRQSCCGADKYVDPVNELKFNACE